MTLSIASRTRWLVLLLFVPVFMAPQLGWSLPLSHGGYDEAFKTHWPRFNPDYDWRWAKAQCYQESLLQAGAVSHAGAMGLCQFMPRTHAECVRDLRLPHNTSPFVAEVSILCNAWYMKKQTRIWTSPRPAIERLILAFAGYNAGAGNILKAQALCAGALLWNGIQPCLKLVTGHHSRETTTYIERIKRWYGELTNAEDVS